MSYRPDRNRQHQDFQPIDHAKRLESQLGNHLNISRPRLKLLGEIIVSMFSCQSVSLSKLGARMKGRASPESQEKRLSRFFPKLQILYKRLGQPFIIYSEVERKR